ncbi:50S ribosomal protein L31e [Candidatus Pacearchaeota archaeon]|nr:50S ribosomal protein L31e [Candidatus Pacearchaeota archaeon]
MAETKSNEFEREYVIPLRKEWSKVARYKRAKKAGKAVKEFLARHMKVYDRDLDKIKLDKYVNEELWFRGIKKPPIRIKIKAIKDSKGIVYVELADMPEKLKFKKAKEEKREKESEKKTRLSEAELKKAGEVKTKHVHKGEEHKHEETKPEETEEKKIEAEEKKASTIEGMEKLEKEMSKKAKHQKGGKQKEPKHQFRKALQK